MPAPREHIGVWSPWKMMVQSIRCRTSCASALHAFFMAAGILLSACGAPAEAPRSASNPPAQREEPAATDSADSPPAELVESPASNTEPPETESEAAPPNQLAQELEKRRQAAKARGGGEEATEEEPLPEEAAPEGPTYTGPDPCRATRFSLDRVREACAAGGRPSAKRIMKDAITKAIAMSHSLGCDDCHVNQRSFELRPNAVEDLKRWLESS